MRLLYFYRYGILGGVSTQLANRLGFLSGTWEAHIAFVEDHGGCTSFGDYPHVHVVPTVREQAELVRGGGFDLVLPIDTPEVFAALRSVSYGGLVINEVHTTTANLGYLERVKSERVDAMVTPSAYLAARIEDEFGYRGRLPCFVVPNCLDTELFAPVELDVAPERPIVLWIGKLDEHKNWRGFLEVGRRLLDRFSDCELIMVGGETAPGAVALELFQEIERQGIAAAVRWLPRVEYRAMPSLYSLAAASGGLTLSTSRDESFGMTVAESLACGCPAVAADVGGIPEILDGRLGDCLYPFFDPGAAAAMVGRLLEDAELRRSLVELGREKVRSTYGLAPAGFRYVQVLDQVRATSSRREAAG